MRIKTNLKGKKEMANINIFVSTKNTNILDVQTYTPWKLEKF